MNILIDDEDNIVSERINIPFNTDFRYSIMFELLMQDNSLSDEEKMLTALQIYYPETDKITDFQKAIADIMWFYRRRERWYHRKTRRNIKRKNKSNL